MLDLLGRWRRDYGSGFRRRIRHVARRDLPVVAAASQMVGSRTGTMFSDTGADLATVAATP